MLFRDISFQESYDNNYLIRSLSFRDHNTDLPVAEILIFETLEGGKDIDVATYIESLNNRQGIIFHHYLPWKDLADAIYNPHHTSFMDFLNNLIESISFLYSGNKSYWEFPIKENN